MNLNKKKIRGWKRRVKILNAWGERILGVDPDVLNEYGRAYQKCIIDPFYRFDKRHPPLWFFKLIVGKLVIAFDAWGEVFKGNGQPYDLQLWIYEPNYIWSQLVCKKVDVNNKKYNYFSEMENQYAFPFEKFANSNPEHLKTFDWARCAEQTYVDQYDIDEGYYTVDELIHNGYEKQTHQNGEIYYAKIIGNVWVGRY
jgi:hypothetical protein